MPVVETVDQQISDCHNISGPKKQGKLGERSFLPIFFNTELRPISSAQQSILEVLNDISGCFKLLQATFGFIGLQFFGEGNLIYSSYHGSWTVFAFPRYLGL